MSKGSGRCICSKGVTTGVLTQPTRYTADLPHFVDTPMTRIVGWCTNPEVNPDAHQAEQQRAERAAEELEELTLRPQISSMALRLKAAQPADHQPAWQRLAAHRVDRVQVRIPPPTHLAACLPILLPAHSPTHPPTHLAACLPILLHGPAIWLTACPKERR